MLGGIVSGAGDFIKGIFSHDKSQSLDWMLEQLSFHTSEDSNDGTALNIYVAIIYDETLAEDLSQRTAEQFVSMLDNLKNDHQGKLAILKWEVMAKNSIKVANVRKYVQKAKSKIKRILLFADMSDKRSPNRYAISYAVSKLRVSVEKDTLVLNGQRLHNKSRQGPSSNSRNMRTNNMSGMQNGMNNMANNMSGMQNSMNGMANSVSGMQNGMNNMANNMSGMQNGMSNMVNSMSGMQNGMSNMVNSMSGMQNGMSNMVNSMSGMQNSMNGMANSVSGMQNDMNGTWIPAGNIMNNR